MGLSLDALRAGPPATQKQELSKNKIYSLRNASIGVNFDALRAGQ